MAMAAAGGVPRRSRSAPPRPDDVPLLLALFRELAEYEHLEDAAEGDRGAARARRCSATRPAAEALIAERGGEPVGYAVFFPTFSTFLAIQGVWLEDLFVRPADREIRRRSRAARGGRGPRARARRRAPGMVGARLERARARVLPRPRRAAHGRLDHPPPHRRGPLEARRARAPPGPPGRAAGSLPSARRPRPRSPMDKTTAS